MPGTSDRSESSVAMQPVPEARSWAEEVAGRLWMLQASFADDPADARHEYLAALMERFPGPERIDAPYFKPPEVEIVKRTAQDVANELLYRLSEFSND